MVFFLILPNFDYPWGTELDDSRRERIQIGISLMASQVVCITRQFARTTQLLVDKIDGLGDKVSAFT
jgi:hypothetical protein